MNELPSMAPETLPLSAEREIDAVCLRFEEALQAGQRPRIEDYLGTTGEPTRSALLAELFRLELDYRSRNGEQPTLLDYGNRFPGPERGVVERVFAVAARRDLPQVPGYEVLAEIGRGGMGVVYKAWQVKASRFVALKMILARELAAAAEIERFITEARAAAGLDHPNIVPIYEVGEHAGRHYFTMKWVPDCSLVEQLSRSPLPSRRAAEIVLTVARAIHHAHQQKIIHRDLKPANILLDEAGQPHVTDFGLAKRLDGEPSKTRTGTVIGTPGYMAPEQAAGRGKEPTATTDVYGLGAVLYALMTGRPPFQAESLLDTLAQVLDQPPAPPRLLNPNIDRDLETICLKCLEKDSAERYVTAADLADELDRYLRGEAIKARPPNWVQSLSREFGKRRFVLDPLSWRYICFYGAAIGFLSHCGLFWITFPGQPTLLFWPIVSVQFGLTALVAWQYLWRRRQSFTPEEGHIAALFYGGYCLACLVLCVVAYPWDRAAILAMYPPLVLLSGLYNLVVARLYWGPLYWYGSAYYLLAVVMIFNLALAPLEFAVVSTAISIISGVLFQLHAKSLTERADKS